VPPVITSTSEATFIANRLQAQDEELAKHAAEGADCPFMSEAALRAAEEGILDDAGSDDDGHGWIDPAASHSQNGVHGDGPPVGGVARATSDKLPSEAAVPAEPRNGAAEFSLLEPVVAVSMTGELSWSATKEMWPAAAGALAVAAPAGTG
jgi:hypothetical protein